VENVLDRAGLALRKALRCSSSIGGGIADGFFKTKPHVFIIIKNRQNVVFLKPRKTRQKGEETQKKRVQKKVGKFPRSAANQNLKRS